MTMRKMRNALNYNIMVYVGVCLLIPALYAASKKADLGAPASPTSPATGEQPVTRHKTNSGLEYEIIKSGEGASPARGQHVTVHYTGWLDNNGQPGAKFDSSVDRNDPFVFIIGIGQVIKGWDEGVMSMKVGEKRRLYIPASLGYGARGAGRSIPPHANLIFDVELISTK